MFKLLLWKGRFLWLQSRLSKGLKNCGYITQIDEQMNERMNRILGIRAAGLLPLHPLSTARLLLSQLCRKIQVQCTPAKSVILLIDRTVDNCSQVCLCVCVCNTGRTPTAWGGSGGQKSTSDSLQPVTVLLEWVAKWAVSSPESLATEGRLKYIPV